MVKSAWNKLFVSLAACGLIAVLSMGASAQEKKAEGKAAPEKAVEKKAEVKKEAPKEGAVKERAKPKGKLPNYYGEVVSGEQREKIYAIQARYTAEIEKLQEQLKALEAKQDAEVEAVLTPDQKDKVAKIAAEAKVKKEKNAEEKKKAAEKPAAEKPAAK